MKKFKLPTVPAIVVICLLAVVFDSQAQMPEYNSVFGDCGHWEIDSISTTSWQNTDTINYKPSADTTWVYSEWKTENKNITYLVYCPCGCGWDTVRFMDRINNVGICQRRYEITSYKYYPRPKTKYEQKRDSILNNR